MFTLPRTLFALLLALTIALCLTPIIRDAARSLFAPQKTRYVYVAQPALPVPAPVVMPPPDALPKTVTGKILRAPSAEGPLAVVIESGVYDLPALTAALTGADNPLTREGATYILRRPLIVGAGATLVMDNVTLRLDGASRAFLLVRGHFLARKSEITGMDKRLAGVAHFRPFITGEKGSWISIEDSTIAHLGYKADLRQGLTLSAGRVTNSRIRSLYHGITLADADRALIAKTLIVNARARGLSLRGGGAAVIVTQNDIHNNEAEGILIQDAGGVLILDNSVTHNGGAGLRLVQSPQAIVHGGRSADNAGPALSLSHTTGGPRLSDLSLGATGNAGLIKIEGAAILSRITQLSPGPLIVNGNIQDNAAIARLSRDGTVAIAPAEISPR